MRLRGKVVYPVELCSVAPGQVYRKKLLPKDQVDFLKFSQQGPRERLGDIRSAVSGQVNSRDPTENDNAKIFFRISNWIGRLQM